MKTFLTILFTLFSLQAFSATVEVISSEIGLTDSNNQKSLCLTVVRIPATNRNLGIVESIEDCFYARKAQVSRSHHLKIDLKKLSPIDHEETREHLQRLDGLLEFYFSDGE